MGTACHVEAARLVAPEAHVGGTVGLCVAGLAWSRSSRWPGSLVRSPGLEVRLSTISSVGGLWSKPSSVDGGTLLLLHLLEKDVHLLTELSLIVKEAGSFIREETSSCLHYVGF